MIKIERKINLFFRIFTSLRTFFTDRKKPGGKILRHRLLPKVYRKLWRDRDAGLNHCGQQIVTIKCFRKKWKAILGFAIRVAILGWKTYFQVKCLRLEISKEFSVCGRRCFFAKLLLNLKEVKGYQSLSILPCAPAKSPAGRRSKRASKLCPGTITIQRFWHSQQLVTNRRIRLKSIEMAKW